VLKLSSARQLELFKHLYCRSEFLYVCLIIVSLSLSTCLLTEKIMLTRVATLFLSHGCFLTFQEVYANMFRQWVKLLGF
jgi:hypothetical protein